MEVILLEDVKTLGKKGDIVKVNDGYGRNFILPKKLGVEATAKSLNELKQQKATEAHRQQELLEEAQAFGKQLSELYVQVKIKTGDNGRVFGSISTKEIAAALKEQHGIELDKKKMQLAEAIRSVGMHSVPVRLHPKVMSELKVKVEEL